MKSIMIKCKVCIKIFPLQSILKHIARSKICKDNISSNDLKSLREKSISLSKMKSKIKTKTIIKSNSMKSNKKS